MQVLPELSVNGPRPADLVDGPPTASARRHLRDGLPEIYQRNETSHPAQRRLPMIAGSESEAAPFAMRFLHAFEEVLDPIVATLDSLPAHLAVDLAPGHALAGLATLLGVDEVESLPAEKRREAVRRAGELGRLRGTRAGLELALSLFFPGITSIVNDHGGVVVSENADEQPAATAIASFDVVCEETLAPETQMAVARCIERWKPVHAHYKLRVRRGSRVRTLPEVPSAPDGRKTPPEQDAPDGDRDGG